MNSHLALGTAQFGLPYGITNKPGQISLDEARKIIVFARKNQITTIDTAIAYGESENVLGQIGLDGFEIISKLPAMPTGIRDIKGWVKEEVSGSLKRLGVDNLEALLLHRPNQLAGTCGNSLAEAMEHVKHEGLVKRIGISIYSPEELRAAMEKMQIQIVQAPFNLIDRQLFSSGWMDEMHNVGIELHARSIFLQGLLLSRDEGIRKKFSRWNDLWTKWDQWLEKESLSPVNACLGFVKSFPQISKLVVGIDSLIHLQELVASSGNFNIPFFPDIECSDIDLINPSRWQLQ